MRKEQVEIQNEDVRPPAANLEMRAAVYRGPSNISLEKVPVPQILEGEILIRVHTCGICGTDLKKIEHGLVAPPRIFGHEISGTVVKTGPKEFRFKVGDRVTTHHHIPCRKCFYCERKLFSQCEFYRRTKESFSLSVNFTVARALPPVSNRQAGVLRNMSG
jgi:L-iditol 2-dehydrogenase